MHKKWSLFDFINILIMIILGIITLYPVLYIVSVSFSDSYYIVTNKVSFFPRGFNIDAYKMILKDSRVPRAMTNSIIYTAAGVFTNVFLTALSAYPLSRRNFFGRKYFMIAIMVTMFFNGGMIPNFIIVQKLNMIDTMWALILPNAIWTFQLIILKSFYQSLPESILESAYIDGASEYLILFRIVIPLSKSALASISLFYFMGHWNSFFLPLIYLNDPKKYPLQLVLRSMIIVDTASNTTAADLSSLTPEAMKDATIVISMVPVLLLYPFLQKYFVKGVTLGSVKG